MELAVDKETSDRIYDSWMTMADAIGAATRATWDFTREAGLIDGGPEGMGGVRGSLLAVAREIEAALEAAGHGTAKADNQARTARLWR